ncbi:hypothetical protein Taro_002743 [Colocasia esculenta]|uniref:Uncharacterized protein n=1 Tax=Colocasia esculenta TaxID=4460 RepID=A0A843TPM2_COLES|nr:hypothetical protein [Colocasia esculenta]
MRMAGVADCHIWLMRRPGWVRSGRGLGDRCITVGNIMPCPEEKFPLSSSGSSGLAERRWLVRSGGVSYGARRRRPWRREVPSWVCVVVATPRCSIPAVCLPADVATAEHVATSEKASSQSDATLSRPRLSRPVFLSRQECCHGALSRHDLCLVVVALTVAMVSQWLRRSRQDLVYLGCFHGHGWRVNVCPRSFSMPRSALALEPRREVRRGATARLGCGGCVVLCCDSLASLYGEVVGRSQQLVSWRSRLCALLLATCGVGLVALVVTVFHSGTEIGFLVALACTVVTPNYCFGNPFLSAVHCGTVGCSSLTSWSVRGVGWFCLWTLNLVEDLVFRELLCLGRCVPRVCFHIVLLWPDLVAGRGFALFLLLWLVRDWLSLLSLVREAHPPTLFRSVLLLLLGARAASVVAVFALAVVGFVLGLRVRLGVSRMLREPACGVAFTDAGMFPVDPVLPEFFSVGSGGVEVHRLAVVFWWCFPELFVVVLCGFPELLVVVLNGALVVLVEVLPEPVVLLPLSTVFSLLAIWLGRVLVRIGRLTLFLTLCGLCQMAVWAACPVFSVRRHQRCLEALVAVWCVALSACVVGAEP